jgi:dolichol kinase
MNFVTSRTTRYEREESRKATTCERLLTNEFIYSRGALKIPLLSLVFFAWLICSLVVRIHFFPFIGFGNASVSQKVLDKITTVVLTNCSYSRQLERHIPKRVLRLHIIILSLLCYSFFLDSAPRLEHPVTI